MKKKEKIKSLENNLQQARHELTYVSSALDDALRQTRLLSGQINRFKLQNLRQSYARDLATVDVSHEYAFGQKGPQCKIVVNGPVRVTLPSHIPPGTSYLIVDDLCNDRPIHAIAYPVICYTVKDALRDIRQGYQALARKVVYQDTSNLPGSPQTHEFKPMVHELKPMYFPSLTEMIARQNGVQPPAYIKKLIESERARCKALDKCAELMQQRADLQSALAQATVNILYTAYKSHPVNFGYEPDKDEAMRLQVENEKLKLDLACLAEAAAHRKTELEQIAATIRTMFTITSVQLPPDMLETLHKFVDQYPKPPTS